MEVIQDYNNDGKLDWKDYIEMVEYMDSIGSYYVAHKLLEN